MSTNIGRPVAPKLSGSPGSFLSANYQLLERVFDAFNGSGVKAVNNAGQSLGTIGGQLTASSGNLNTANTTLGANWQGPAATKFTADAGVVKNYGVQLGADLGTVNALAEKSAAGQLNYTSAAMQASYDQFLPISNEWYQKFIPQAAQKIVDAARAALAKNAATPATAVPFNTSNFRLAATISTSGPTMGEGSGYPAAVQTGPSSVTITITPAIPPTDGAGPQGQPAVFANVTTVNMQQLAQAVQLAEIDQYLVQMRDNLTQLGSTYTSAAGALPKVQAGPHYGAKGTGGGGGGTGGGFGAANLPNSSAGPMPQLSSGNGQGAGSGSGAGVGAGSGAGQAGAGSGAGGSGLSSSGSPTSLASAPAGTLPTTGSGTLPTTGDSTLPTVGTVPTDTAGATGTTPLVPFLGSSLPLTSEGGSGISPLSGGGLGETGSPLLDEGAGGVGDGVLTGAGEPSTSDTTGLPADEAALAESAGSGTGHQTPYMPYMPMTPGMGGSDNERKRSVWLDDDEDIWSTDTDPAPAVIGG